MYLYTVRATGRQVAVKRLRQGMGDGGRYSSMREVKLLAELKHPNVIDLVESILHKERVYLVYELCDSDLETVIRDKGVVLKAADRKAYLQMLLRGVAACHGADVLHRDLKPNNLLIAPDGQLKLIDFGMGRKFGSPGRRMSTQVCTRWYRAPELLYGATYYGTGVDLWTR